MAGGQQDPPLRTFHPRWPARSAIDAERVTFNYWHEIDTLVVDFTGGNAPAVSVPLDLGDDRHYMYLRLDPTTENVRGLQIEEFLAYAVHRHPALLDTLDLASLHGITAAEISNFHRNLDQVSRKCDVVTAIVNEIEELSA
jgi:hypothetical protein